MLNSLIWLGWAWNSLHETGIAQDAVLAMMKEIIDTTSELYDIIIKRAVFDRS